MTQQKEVATTSTVKTDGMIFEEKPFGMLWALFAAGILFGAFMLFGAFRPGAQANIGLAVGGGCVALACGALAVFTFGARHNSKRFYADRVDLFERGQPTASLPYDQVEQVAYGFKGDGDQFLKFSGPGQKLSISLNLIGSDAKARLDELNNARLMWLRELLYNAVADRLVRQAATPPGGPWFGTLRISVAGLRIDDAVIPWSAVQIDANEKNGRLTVQRDGQMLGATSMIEDNVVAGLLAVERLGGTRS